MHFCTHQARAATQEFEREPFFVIRKGHGYNRYLVFYSQPEGAVLEFIEQDRAIFGNATFWEYTNAQSLLKPFLRPLENFKAALGTAAVNKYAGALIKKTRIQGS